MGWCHDSIVPWPPSLQSSPAGEKAIPPQYIHCSLAAPMFGWDQWTWLWGPTRDQHRAVGQAWTIDHSYDSSSKTPGSPPKAGLGLPLHGMGLCPRGPQVWYTLPKGGRGSPQSSGVAWTMPSAGQTEIRCSLGAADERPRAVLHGDRWCPTNTSLGLMRHQLVLSPSLDGTLHLS